MVASFTDWDKDPNYLAHFGAKGMKWGQRRYQNPDGSLTSLGKERYGSGGKASARRMTRDLNKLDREKAYTKTRLRSATSRIARKDARYAKKLDKANESGNTKKAARIAAKRDNLKNSRTAKKISAYSELMNKNKAMTDKILDAAKRSGMKVNSRDTVRITNKGRGVAAALGVSAVGAAAKYGAKRLLGTKVTEGGKTIYGQEWIPGDGNPRGINGGKGYIQYGPVMTKGGTSRIKTPWDGMSSTARSGVKHGARAAAIATQVRTEKGTHYSVKKNKKRG